MKKKGSENIDKDSENNDKILRIFQILKYIANGNYKTSDLLDLLAEDEFIVSVRTLQRDLLFLKENNYIVQKKKNYWSLQNSISNNLLPINISGSEFLSFCILKSFIKSFKGTKIENDINKLELLLKNKFPEIDDEEQIIFWDQNFGYYDYSDKAHIISKLTYHIVHKNFVKIIFLSDPSSNKIFEVFPIIFYYYNGTIYLYAYYPQKEDFITFTLQNIIEVELYTDEIYKIPEFDLKKFKTKRFGVYSGNTKEIRVNIDKDYKKYFENRHWHPSQKSRISPKTGNLILEMNVPITPELISWLLGWGEAITVESPLSLRRTIKEKANIIARKYENY
mgnify:CR=1 FL=1